jgi:CheY-like chemotaxis protein
VLHERRPFSSADFSGETAASTRWLAKEPPQVLVTDLGMPRVDGCVLLLISRKLDAML